MIQSVNHCQFIQPNGMATLSFNWQYIKSSNQLTTIRHALKTTTCEIHYILTD